MGWVVGWVSVADGSDFCRVFLGAMAGEGTASPCSRERIQPRGLGCALRGRRATGNVPSSWLCSAGPSLIADSAFWRAPGLSVPFGFRWAGVWCCGFVCRPTVGGVMGRVLTWGCPWPWVCCGCFTDHRRLGGSALEWVHECSVSAWTQGSGAVGPTEQVRADKLGHRVRVAFVAACVRSACFGVLGAGLSMARLGGTGTFPRALHCCASNRRSGRAGPRGAPAKAPVSNSRKRRGDRGIRGAAWSDRRLRLPGWAAVTGGFGKGCGWGLEWGVFVGFWVIGGLLCRFLVLYDGGA